MIFEIYYSNCSIEFPRDKIYKYLMNIFFYIFVFHPLCTGWNINSSLLFSNTKIYFSVTLFFFFFLPTRKSRSLITRKRKKISNFFPESVHLSKKVLCNFFVHHFRQSDSLNLINQPSESIQCLLRSNTPASKPR